MRCADMKRVLGAAAAETRAARVDTLPGAA
jgi:hypothetical protein